MNDTMMKGVSTAVIVGGIMLFFGLMKSLAKLPPQRDPETGDLLLRFSRVWSLLFAVLTIAVPIVLVVIAYNHPPKTPGETWGVWIGGIAFTLFIGLISWSLQRSQVRVTQNSIEQSGLLGIRKFSWKDVASLRFKSDGSLQFRSREGTKITVTAYFTGAAELLPILKQSLPPQLQAESAPQIDKFREFLQK